MSDLISRKAAIDAILSIKDYGNSDRANALGLAEFAITTLPSAQPEIDCMLKEYGDCTYSETGCSGCKIKAEIKKALKFAQPVVRDINVLSNDLINRKTAIDALGKEGLVTAMVIIDRLPSAQPEPLTDKEQRIFLAAMGREEKVCEEVDRNHVREPYEDSLMRVCKEIRRKVKSALWI